MLKPLFSHEIAARGEPPLSLLEELGGAAVGAGLVLGTNHQEKLGAYAIVAGLAGIAVSKLIARISQSQPVS